MTLQGEAAAVASLAVEHEARPGRVLVREPRLVEEGHLHRAAVIGDRRLDERPHPPAPDRPRADRDHRDDDGRGLARDQRGDGASLAAIMRQVLEQVADGLETERLGALGRLGALELERTLEP